MVLAALGVQVAGTPIAAAVPGAGSWMVLNGPGGAGVQKRAPLGKGWSLRCEAWAQLQQDLCVSLPAGEEAFEYCDVVINTQEKVSDVYTQLEKLGE